MARTASSLILQLIRRVHRDPRVEGSADQDLLRRFVGERDEAAFETLLRRHGAMVLDVCRGVLGNEADVEDAFQATFLILARRAESIRKGASLACWLHGVAYRTALRARADCARRQRHEARTSPRCTTTDPDELTWREIRRVVHEELDRLPERHRTALVLCYLQGKTQDEAAVELGLPKGTLKGHLERGRSRLHARLVRRGLGPGAVLALAAWPASAKAAGLSHPLDCAIVKTATAFAAGKAGVSDVSPNVAALSEGMVKAMFFRKLKIAAILLLALAGSGTGLARFIQGPPRTDAGAAGEQSVSPAKPERGADVAAKPGADSNRPIRSLRGHVNRLTSIAYSPDGKSIATASLDGTVRIWNAMTGEEVRRLGLDKGARLQTEESSSNTFDQIAFSPDNAFLVTVKRGSTVPPQPPPAPPPDKSVVIVWNPRTGEKLRTFPADGASFAISPDGKLIACGGYQVIHLYELATGKRVRELNGGKKQLEIVSLTFSPDGQTLISSGRPPTPQREDISPLAIFPDAMRLWDMATGKERPSALNGVVVGRHGRPRIVFSKDGRTVIHASEVPPPGDSGYDISLREVATGGERTRLTGHKFELRAFALSPNGRTLASGSMDGTVRLWDLPSGKEVGRLGKEVDPVKGGWVLDLAFSPDGRTLVSGGLDKTAHIWDVSRITERRRRVTERSLAELEDDWKDLAGDAAAGYAAMGRLVSFGGRAVAFLEKQLQSTPPPDIRRIERLIADLDHEQFDVRERAAGELEKLGECAEPALRKALAGKPSLEARGWLERLLNRLEGASPSAETVRQIRAVEALESIAELEAQRMLNKLAAGPPEWRLTQEARAAVRRLPPTGP
jgi:RNA polymerase sigma factor (sigma-70 family)